MPLYGDMSIFNPAPPSMDDGAGDDGDKVLWGELEEVAEEQEEEVVEEEEEEEDDDHKSGIQSTLPSGMDTPSQFELRKGLETPESTTTGGLDTPSNKPGELFRELRQEASSVGGECLFFMRECLFGLSAFCVRRAYGVELPLCYSNGRRWRGCRIWKEKGGAFGKQEQGGKMCDVWRVRPLTCDAFVQSALDSVDVALDPSEMEGMDEQALKDKYDDFVKEQRKANSSSLPDDNYEDDKKIKKKKQKVALDFATRRCCCNCDDTVLLPLLLLMMMLFSVGQQEGQGLPLLNFPAQRSRCCIHCVNIFFKQRPPQTRRF
jgi:splicing factor 3B subunit 2